MALFEIVGFTDFTYGYRSMMVKAATLYHLKKTEYLKIRLMLSDTLRSDLIYFVVLPTNNTHFAPIDQLLGATEIYLLRVHY